MNFNGLITLKCPKCGQGNLYSGFFKMHNSCTSCAFKFERQEGYFTSAIFIGNFLYALIVAPTLLIMSTLDIAVWKIALTLGLFSTVAIPLVFHYARSIWLYIDFMIHPE